MSLILRLFLYRGMQIRLHVLWLGSHVLHKILQYVMIFSFGYRMLLEIIVLQLIINGISVRKKGITFNYFLCHELF